MLSFHQIVLRKFFLLFIILFLIIGAIVYYWTKDFYTTQTKKSLLQNIEIVSFELHQDTDLDVLATKIKNSLHLRLTIISEDGTVIAESHKNKDEMDNHKNREEIIQANVEEYGYKIRHSNTINTNLLYIAKKYTKNNTTTYIRMAQELKNINHSIISLGLKIAVTFSIFFIVIFLTAYKISKQLERETKKVATFLTSLTRKKKSVYLSSNFSLEFAQITNLLSKVSLILTKKEKQKSKYTSKLKTSNQQKDDIISAISHEFKNPISVMNGYAQTLLDDKNITPAMRDKFLTKIYQNGVKLSELIDRLRLSVKLDDGHSNLHLVNINLYNITIDTIDTLKQSYPNRKITLQGQKDVSIKADGALFGIVVSNLIENALKYSKDEIVVSFDSKSYNVTDTGIGISKENLLNITRKFYRVHENSWNNSLGLGLFLVSNIVKQHNFSLNVKSIQTQGSTFSVEM